MTPKIVDKEARKQSIALAALTLFAEQGFEAASMSQVAAAAGIGKGTIYEYFNSKQDLTVAAVAAWVNAMEEGLSPLLNLTGDPRTRLTSLFRATTSAFLQDPKVIQLFLGLIQMYLRHEELRPELKGIKDVAAPIRRAIVAILLDGVKQGILKPQVADDAEKIAINLVAFVDGLGLHYVTHEELFDLHEQIDLYLTGLFAHLSLPRREGEPVNHTGE